MSRAPAKRSSKAQRSLKQCMEQVVIKVGPVLVQALIDETIEEITTFMTGVGPASDKPDKQ